MAYVSKEKKEEIRQAVKKVMPQDWKWSLAVKNYSTIILTISKAPIDLVAVFCDSADAYNKRRVDIYGEREQSTERQRQNMNYNVSKWTLQHMTEGLQNRYVAAIFSKIFDAMNTGNYDNSDVMTDYFDVGHYIEVQIGSWKTPFKLTTQTLKAA